MGGRMISWHECVNCKRLYEDIDYGKDVEPCCPACLAYKYGDTNVNPRDQHDPERDR